MGVDVNLYAIGEVTDEQLAEAEKLVTSRGLDVGWEGSPALERAKYYDDDRIELNTLSRYYGPDYERGSWPSIFAMIRVLQAALPQCSIYYGGDTTDDGEEVTPEMLEGIWRHWLGPDGDGYHNRRSGWRAAQIDGEVS